VTKTIILYVKLVKRHFMKELC